MLLWFSRTLSLALVVASCLVYGQEPSRHHLPKRIVGDYGYWSKYQTPPYTHAEIPYQKLTHINHAGISFNADGSLSVPDGFIEPELNNRATPLGCESSCCSEATSPVWRQADLCKLW